MKKMMPSSVKEETEWWQPISRRVQEREIARQLRHNSFRQAAARIGRKLPALLPEFLKMVAGSAIAFWLITAALAYLFHAGRGYTLPAFGLLYSFQAAYYTQRLASDPDYKIPKCRCAGRGSDNAELVLGSRQGLLLRIPPAFLGIILYSALPLAFYLGHTGIALGLAIAGCLMSVYLSYIMVVRIASLCVTCINIVALNALLLWHFSH